jgi:hypothetical protein
VPPRSPAKKTRAAFRLLRLFGAAVPYLVQCDGEKLVAEAATVSEAIQAGEKAELEGRNAVRIITPSGQSFSVSEYKVIVAGVRVESE